MKGYERRLISRDGVPLAVHVQPGGGPLVVFQHGLCGDAEQPAEVFPSGHGFRHMVMGCRGHGESGAGDPAGFSVAGFAGDLVAAIGEARPVAVGGISMGAAIALRLAVRQPGLVPALILSRPAWSIGDAPANMRPNAEVGLMLKAGLDARAFAASEVARGLAGSPDNLASLRGLFGREPRGVTADLLIRIPADGPGVSEAEVAGIRAKTLILATEEDAIHPMEHAERLAGLIPGARLVKVPPKGRDRVAHVAAMRETILTFLKGLT